MCLRKRATPQSGPSGGLSPVLIGPFKAKRNQVTLGMAWTRLADAAAAESASERAAFVKNE